MKNKQKKEFKEDKDEEKKTSTKAGGKGVAKKKVAKKG